MRAPDKSRILAGIASAAFDALILIALITGLSFRPDVGGSSHLITVALTVPPAPHQKQFQTRLTAQHRHRHALAPNGARAAPVLAYVPRIPLAKSATPAALNPDSGFGSNSGMVGQGSSGGSGNGNLGGDSGGSGENDAVWLSGEIGNSDYPHQAADRGAQGTVRTEITISPQGRVSRCQVTRSSGDLDLDATTCRLLLKRFRFRPATDDSGHSIVDTVEYDQEWVLSRTADLPASD